jgi:hypothetical protein
VIAPVTVTWSGDGESLEIRSFYDFSELTQALSCFWSLTDETGTTHATELTFPPVAPGGSLTIPSPVNRNGFYKMSWLNLLGLLKE